MEGLFEALLSNPFFILIILGGLMSFFRDKSKATDEEETTVSRPQPSRTERQSQPKKVPLGRMSTEKEATEQMDTRSVTEHRDEQMERLMKQFNVEEDQVTEDSIENQAQSVRSLGKRTQVSETLKQKDFKKRMKDNTTKKGLLNGVIMAEVLGPPRAQKPYRSVIQDRQK